MSSSVAANELHLTPPRVWIVDDSPLQAERVEAHQGSISVSSTEAEGTAFTVRLPGAALAAVG